MANFGTTAAARVTAENLVKTRMDAKTWVEGYMTRDFSGNVIVRFIRPMATTSDTTRAYGAWTESRADDIDA